MSLKLKLLLLLLGLIGIGVFFNRGYLASNDPKVSQEIETRSPDPIAKNDKKPAVQIPESWLKYRGKVGNYSVSYPADLKLEADGEQSVRFVTPDYKPRMGDANFAYVSVVAKDKPETVGEFYNYNSTQVGKLLSVEVGEEVNLADLDQLKEWYRYIRLPDISLGELVGRGFENLKPWEFPGGTVELYYIVDSPDFTYVVGGYTQDTAGLQRDELEMIIASFRVDIE